jgi:hypothetical protein
MGWAGLVGHITHNSCYTAQGAGAIIQPAARFVPKVTLATVLDHGVLEGPFHTVSKKNHGTVEQRLGVLQPETWKHL